MKLHARATDFITLQKCSISTLFTRKRNWMCPTNRDHLRARSFIYCSGNKDKSFILQLKGDHSIKKKRNNYTSKLHDTANAHGPNRL